MSLRLFKLQKTIIMDGHLLEECLWGKWSGLSRLEDLCVDALETHLFFLYVIFVHSHDAFRMIVHLRRTRSVAAEKYQPGFVMTATSLAWVIAIRGANPVQVYKFLCTCAAAS